MPSVLVYEHLTAHGIGRDPGSTDHGMYREGRAMRDAALADFQAVPGVRAETIDDRPLKQHKMLFRSLTAGFDLLYLIAPEPMLRRLTEWATKNGTPVLGCSEDSVSTCGCKHALSTVWDESGVPTPMTDSFLDWLREPPKPYPVVIKPDFGAGSEFTHLVRNDDEYRAVWDLTETEGVGETTLITQLFVPGRPVSIAFLIGPNQTVPLVPTFQRLTADGRFHYLGGELPIPPALAERAVNLGRRAVGCVPGLAGYVGVDLILGDAADGSADYAIEINPRLTTSYVGLRALADFNLAAAMLDVFEGRSVGEMRWKPGRVRFDAGGAVVSDSSASFWE